MEREFPRQIICGIGITCAAACDLRTEDTGIPTTDYCPLTTDH